jgi:hypothetical protein
MENNQQEPFDEDDYDYRVAESITNIHMKVKQNQNDKKYFKWVEDNIVHLQNLYNLSGLNIKPHKFYSFIYNNTKIENN